MKYIKNITDRKIVYRVEAARISYEILQESYNDLIKTLRNIETTNCNYANSLLVMRNVWQFIDYSFRFSSIIGQIKGLKHKDIRFKETEKCAFQIERARNFVQHLNSGIQDLLDETYPILGAISWSSIDKKKSYTVSLGALPPGTKYHTLGYNKEEKKYGDDVILNVDSFGIYITKSFFIMTRGWEYLNEWLLSQNMLDVIDMEPNFMVAGPLDEIRNTKKFVRIEISTKKKSEEHI